MKYILAYILCLVVVGCNNIPYSKHKELADLMIASSAKIIVNKWGIKLVGTGAAMTGGPIRKLTLSFNTSMELTRDQLRVNLIDAANIVVNEVNKNQKFRNIFLILLLPLLMFKYYKDARGHEVYEPVIATAKILNGILSSSTVDESNI